MRYASICSGIEAATLAWESLGWQPVFVSEIEPFPSAVLQARWNATPPKRPLDPDEAKTEKDKALRAKWLKQIKQLPQTGTLPNLGDFTKIERDDYEGNIDLLVGGCPCQSFSNAGLRGGLQDQRGNLTLEYTRLAYRTGTRWLVYENVPGILTSNKGSDFATFLSLLCGWEVKVPKGGWQRAGIISPAPGCFGLAWRVLDTQYTRVSQFPRAIPQRRRRLILVGYLGDWLYPTKVLFEGEIGTGDAPPKREKRSTISADAQKSTRTTCTVRMRAGNPELQGGRGALVSLDRSLTLATQNDQTLIDIDNYEATICPNTCPTLDASYPNHQNSQDVSKFIAYKYKTTGLDLQCDDKGNIHHNKETFKETDTNDSQNASLMEVIAIDGDKIGKKERAGGSGLGINTDGVMYTETVKDVHAVCNMPNVVRRLLPVECERLMGMPDGYTQISWKGKPKENCPDSPRYKALGNSMCVNVMQWVGERIDAVENNKEI